MKNAPIRDMKAAHLAAILLGTLGALFFVVGLLLLRDADARAHARAPTFVTPASLGARAHGVSVALVGRIAPENPMRYRQFVAFDREEFVRYVRTGNEQPRAEWRRVEHVRPHLSITDATGVAVDMIGDDYRFEGVLGYVGDDTLHPASVSTPASTRAHGFSRGDRVVVVGTVVSAHVITAHTLFRGSRADYVHALATAVTTSSVLGATFTGLGAMLCVIVLVVLRRDVQTLLRRVGAHEGP